MQPNSEPTQADIAAVAAAIGEPVAPVAPVAPAPAPVEQPTPTQPTAPAEPVTDPFASLFAQPTEPTAPVAPTQPTEPMPTPQQPMTPVEPSQPTQAPPTTPTAPAEPTYKTYDEYMQEVLKGVPEAPKLPSAENVDPNSPEGIESFFNELVETAVARAKQETARSTAIQTSERNLWEESFTKYGSLRTNKPLRDMVHDIRMGYFRRGIAMTPTQAADKLLESLGNQYKQGVADNSVITTIENVQPTGGGTGAPVTTTLDKDNVLTSVQTGGEAALANYLDAQIRAGKL